MTTISMFFIALTVLQLQYTAIYASCFTDNYMSNITISVAWDTWGTSGSYFVSGCSALEPYFENTNHSLYLYWDNEHSFWLIAKQLGNYSDWKAMCTSELLSDCSFFQWIIYEPIEIDWDSVNYTNKILMFGLPFSIIIWYTTQYFVLWIGYQKALTDPNPNFFNKDYVNKNVVELQVTNNDKSNTSHDPSINTEEISEKTWKTKAKFMGKLIFHFVLKPCLEGYDFYTDVVLALLWLNGFYGLRTGDSANTCLIKLENYAYALLILSSIGFLIGVIGHIYFLFVSYNRTAIKQQSLSMHNQAKVGYFTFGKALIEDTASIIILLSVAINEIGVVTDIEWWLAYYSSCAAFAVSSIIFIRSEMTNKCPTIEHLKNHKVCQWIYYFIFVFWCMVPGTAPLYPIGMYSYGQAQLGFSVNDNECQRRSFVDNKQYGQDGSMSFLEYNFDVDDDNYGIYCFGGYDHVTGGFDYIDGMRCNVFDRSFDKKLCNFWMYSNDCWTGECPPYSDNMTACFGYIGF